MLGRLFNSLQSAYGWGEVEDGIDFATLVFPFRSPRGHSRTPLHSARSCYATSFVFTPLVCKQVCANGIKTKRCRFATSPCFVCFVRVEDGIRRAKPSRGYLDSAAFGEQLYIFLSAQPTNIIPSSTTAERALSPFCCAWRGYACIYDSKHNKKRGA